MFAHDSNEKASNVEIVKEQPMSTKGERMASSDVSLDSTTRERPKDANSQAGPLQTSGVNNGLQPQMVYGPQQVYYAGYDNSIGEWDEYPQYINADVVEMASPGVYHPGYGYNPQMPYGPYSPATTPVPPLHPDGALFPPAQFPFTGSYYPPTVPPSMPYITSPTHVSQGDLSLTSSIDQQRDLISDSSINNSIQFGPRPSYSSPHGSLGRGSFSGNAGNTGYYDMRQGFNGLGSGGSWSDRSKSSDGSNRSLNTVVSSPAGSQPVAAFGHRIAPLAPGTVPSLPIYGSGASTSSYNRAYGHGGLYHPGGNFGRSVVGLETNSRSWIAVDKGRQMTRDTGSLCSCNGTLDILGEQNKGPRATRPRSIDQDSHVDSKNGRSSLGTTNEKYNSLDFVIEYEDAMFFIIKSYNEDNVHKSIKYGVWASTPSGNRKLDSAYRESKEKDGSCPVYLLFSVNASGQFCGIAEMVGPVDFDKSVNYWQQDKWSGQFPVKWHIVKDVPNSLFRHIIIENNDNKPVTNSRDTQEVRLNQGLEMLKIFKTYDSSVSILDDFDFYEEREIAIQERKARQQASFVGPVTTNGNQTKPLTIPGELVKSFASVVRLGESKAAGAEERSGELRAGNDTHETEKGAIVTKSDPDK